MGLFSLHPKLIKHTGRKIGNNFSTSGNKFSDGSDFLVGHGDDGRQKQGLVSFFQNVILDLVGCDIVILVKQRFQSILNPLSAVEIIMQGAF